MGKKEKTKVKYKKFTMVGYFGLGLIVLFAGFIYSALDSDTLQYNGFLMNILFSNLRLMLASVFCSAFFYWIFFCIRRGIQSISEKFNDSKSIENRVFELRKEYKKIKERKDDNKSIDENDIDRSLAETDTKEALKKWLEIKNDILKKFSLYFAYVMFCIIFLFDDYQSGKFYFFLTYTFLFFVATLFYVLLFSNLCIMSFFRLSYGVLYPTILSIAVNLYFGLSVNDFCVGEFEKSALWPIVIFAIFFVVTVIFESVSYKEEERGSAISTYGFVFTSIILLSISILFFYMATKHIMIDVNTNSFSKELFAIALALYLGIFEGWDALNQMNLSEESDLFAKHYRWWNFLQVCYPLAFFFLMVIVDSKIFTFGLMLFFSVVSVISTVIWKRGGEQNEYCETNWAFLKLSFGLITIFFIFVNKIIFMNANFRLNMFPDQINANVLDITFITFLLGLFNSLVVLCGVKTSQRQKYLIMAIPFKKASKYKEFSEFCSCGYIYDFSNYIYIFYLFIFHKLLFETNIVPSRSPEAEKTSCLLLIFIIIIYMIFSVYNKIDSKSEGSNLDT